MVNGQTIQVPALLALWDDRNGSLYYVVGRYNTEGKVEWSDQVEFGQPSLNTGETVIGQNPQGTFSIGPGGNEPRVLVAYEIFNAAFQADTTWSGTDDDGKVYTIQFQNLVGTDNNGDGIISGRSTNSTLTDGIANELISLTVITKDANGDTPATYDLEQLQEWGGFNLNLDPNTNRVLANADPTVFSAPTGEFGLGLRI